MREETLAKTCSVERCDRIGNDARGMCGMHAQRVRRYGDPHYKTSEIVRRATSRAAQPRLGKLKQDTYPKLFGRHAHRVIAEQMLGRTLLPGEVVHHKDGNKHNNAPENLEVITQPEHVRQHRPEMIRAQRAKSAKLKQEDITLIRDLLAKGCSQASIAKRLCVSQSLICAINRGKAWRDV